MNPFLGIRHGVVTAVLCVASGSAFSLAQDSATIFTLQSATPVVSHSPELRAWDSRYTDPGAVFYHDGQFHMFRNGFQGWPASVQIGYLTSPDGVIWTEASEDPVLTTDEVEYAGVAALASSAFVQDDGTWVLYFYTWNNHGRMGEGEIGRATAAGPLGPWTPDAEPVLTHGAEGEWDSGSVTTPTVVQTDDGSFVMYYTATDPENNFAIGMATSDDGIEWAKYDDPATTAAPFAESDPVLTTNEDEEGPTVHQPHVVHTPHGWVMLYRIGQLPDGDFPAMRLAIATSEDGINWSRDERNPIFSAAEIPDAKAFYFSNITYHDGTYYLYVEAAPFTPDVTDIYALSAESLFGEM